MVRIGWIGLGAMGAPMATHAARAGHDITTYDVAPDRGDAASAAEAARDADVLVLMVATADQADAALAEVGDTDATLLVMSTVGPAAVEQWAKTYTVVDAPVSGGVARAGEGDLLIMVSGAADAIERVRPLLDSLARSAPVVGDQPGDGQKVKLVNQLLCGVHIAAAGEALAYAEGLGLDPRFVFETIRHGAANSFMLEDRGERMVDREFVPPKSALDIFVKDMGLVLGAAEERGFSAPLASAARELYESGAAMGLGAEDDSGVIRVFEHRADQAGS